MTPFEAAIDRLLGDVEPLLRPFSVPAQRWVIVAATKTSTQSQLQVVENDLLAMTFSWGTAKQRIEALQSYEAAKALYNDDDVFGRATSVIGFEGTFERFFQRLLCTVGQFRGTRVRIDHVRAIRMLQSLRAVLQRSKHAFTATARVIGIKLKCRSLTISNRVEMRRLSTKQRNERSRILMPERWSDADEGALLKHSTELSASIEISSTDVSTVGGVQAAPLLAVHDQARRTAEEVLGAALQALLVSLQGEIALGPVDIQGGLSESPSRDGSRRVQSSADLAFPDFLELGKKDASRLAKAFELLSASKPSDRILQRAIHRFVIGRQRADLKDALVDYVIAWESILLTQNGSAASDELSYRFALNGAAAIAHATRKRERVTFFKKMKAAYSSRSKIVHGDEDQSLQKALRSGNFDHLGELCNFLETSFRGVVFWIDTIDVRRRPYLFPNGWEYLTWNEQPTDQLPKKLNSVLAVAERERTQ